MSWSIFNLTESGIAWEMSLWACLWRIILSNLFDAWGPSYWEGTTSWVGNTGEVSWARTHSSLPVSWLWTWHVTRRFELLLPTLELCVRTSPSSLQLLLSQQLEKKLRQLVILNNWAPLGRLHQSPVTSQRPDSKHHSQIQCNLLQWGIQVKQMMLGRQSQTRSKLLS